MEDEINYVDSPNKELMHPHYEHRTTKLDLKNNNFTSKEFQKVRKVSTQRNLLKSFGRIGMRINNTPISILPKKDLNKVCFVIINDYKPKNKNFGVGPLNDGYLIALKHHRLGFKIFYLYNASIKEFPIFLQFFMNNTIKELSVFYTGRDGNSEGIEFKNGILSKKFIEKLISSNCNGILRIVFITDTVGSGSVFDTRRCSNAMSFFVDKNSNNSCELNKLHGIFTYYLCKIIDDCQGTTPNMLVQKLNSSLSRFNETFRCELTNKEQSEMPIFFG